MSTSVTIEQPVGAVIAPESAVRVIAEIRRAPEAWGTCPDCTTSEPADLVAVRAALHREWLPVYGGPPIRACLVADLLAALRVEHAGGVS